MKLKLITIPCIIIFIYYLFTNNLIVEQNISNTCNLFITKVFVSLYPMYIISKLLLNYNIPYYISKYFKSNFIYITILSILSGSPSNAIIITDLYNNKQINLFTANKHLLTTYYNNPLFLYNMLSLTFPKTIVIIIIICSYITNLIIYLFIKDKNNLKITKLIEQPLSTSLINSINSSIPIFLNIFCTMIIFNLLAITIPNQLTALKGLLELTNGLSFLINYNRPIIIKSLLALIYINFGGLSINTQIKSILKDTKLDYSKFLLARFYSCIISITLFLPLYYILLFH